MLKKEQVEMKVNSALLYAKGWTMEEWLGLTLVAVLAMLTVISFGLFVAMLLGN